MDPPSYEESRLQNPAVASHPPPPSYQPSPPSPPPSYNEAVPIPPDPFPVLTPPVFPAAATQNQNPGAIIHPITQIGAVRPVISRQAPAAVQVIVAQPQAVPVQIHRLTNIPGLVRCPNCRQTVITKATHAPGPTAWFLCVFIALTGLICGFCVIPLVMPSLQETRHSCPQCKVHLFTYRK